MTEEMKEKRAKRAEERALAAEANGKTAAAGRAWLEKHGKLRKKPSGKLRHRSFRQGLPSRQSALPCFTCGGSVGVMTEGQDKKYCSPECRARRHNKRR